MSYEIQTTKDFERSLKKLSKRYRSLYEDYGKFLDSLQDNPFQGAELYPNIRKIRMAIASKGKGKAGSARVITANAIVAEQQGSIALLTLYDKSDAATVDINIVKQMAKELGFDI
jgi:mRNA-degrading endonuclease RelE of RelBE toxin-antitoxin system